MISESSLNEIKKFRELDDLELERQRIESEMFGDHWRSEMMKFTKDGLIDRLRLVEMQLYQFTKNI